MPDVRKLGDDPSGPGIPCGVPMPQVQPHLQLRPEYALPQFEAEGEMPDQVIATVDAGRSNAVVWWTNIRPERTASMARNCGAWTLDLDDAESLRSVISGKICLATPTGRRLLAKVGKSQTAFLDHGATLAGVLGEQSRLSTIHATTSSKTSTKELRWPVSPRPLDVSKAKLLSAPRPVQRALAIANWLVDLSEFWEGVEAVRLSRPALRKHDGIETRDMPIVLEASNRDEPMTLALDL